MRTFLKTLFAELLYYSGLLRFYLCLRNNFFGSEKVKILLYHRVLDLQKERAFCSLPGIIVSVKMFDEQMKYLSENYNVISLENLVDTLKHNLPFPKKGVVITFDDGWKDNFSFAFPILKKYDLPATIFLTSGYVGTEKTFWAEQVISILKSEKILKEKLSNLSDDIYPIAIQHCLDDLIQEREISLHTPYPNPLPQRERELHKFSPPLMGGSKGKGDTLQYKKHYLDVLTDLIERLKYLPPLKRELIIDDLRKRMGTTEKLFSDDHSMLSWEEIGILEKNHISFGSHSINHPILTQLDETEAKKEIFDSKREIEKKLSRTVLAFAYPNGDLNDLVKDLVKKAGYLCAVALGAGLNGKHADVFSLTRKNIHESSSAGLGGRFSKALFACQINGILDLL
jgi:peptidoglycan/xylan/chitin deacetylase (PgdA/CDA1 family)